MAAPTIDLLSKFSISGRCLEVTELKRGHINETFVSVWEQADGRRRYIHQRINKEIFRDLPLLMRNIHAVTSHLREKFSAGFGEPGETTLQVIATRFGAHFVQDELGEYWRTYAFVEGGVSVNVASSPEQAFEVARAFGRFLRLLSDLPVDRLGEPIPRFQDPLFRFEQLNEALAADSVGRKKDSGEFIEFALARRTVAEELAAEQRRGGVKLRPTHSDPKINNVLLNPVTGKAICVVDLDTCMPGSVVYDYGDLARNTAVACEEDEQDLAKVVVRQDMLDAVSRGYLQEAGSLLTTVEKELMRKGPGLLALNLGVRFLTDHLNGDRYFRVHRPNHNRDRARTQFCLARQFLEL